MPQLVLILLFLVFSIASSSTSTATTITTTTEEKNNSSSSSSDKYCELGSLPDPLRLRADKLTVLISGYSPSRIHLLTSLALSYSTHPSVSSVLILWFNPSFTPPSHLFSSLPSSISLHLHPSSSSPSLSLRFLPRPQILTRSVLVCDDDVHIPLSSLSFAFRIFSSSSSDADAGRLVGFFARSHDLDLSSRSWIYTIHPDRYSMILTKAVILKTEYLYRYSCWDRLREARALVHRERNCEDILMNFVAAMDHGSAAGYHQGPILVQGRRGVRDWGDPRNTNHNNISSSIDKKDQMGGGGGLSGRGDHMKKRGECITQFHRLLGEMPLRYSYAKMVEGVGEQALCRKGNNLVYCDQDQDPY